MNKTIGFIVVNSFGRVLGLGEDNVLCPSGAYLPVTVFPTRQRANAAIRRTKRYAAKMGYSTGTYEPWGGQRVVPLVSEK